MKASRQFQQLRISDQASLQRTFSSDDLTAWRRLAGVTAATTTVPEPLIAGLFSCLLGENLPGHGTNYLKQHMTFEHAALADEPLTATVKITRLRPDKALVNLDTVCTDASGRIICTGQALVLFRR